jgi:hypothetical protein
MKCSYLSGTHIVTCKANKGIYSPSLFELYEYCLSDKCKMCPRPSLTLFGIVHANDEGHEKKQTPQLKAA